METAELIAYLKERGYEVKKYSGRGMGGRYCVGFTAHAMDNWLGDLFNLVAGEPKMDVRKALAECFEDTQTDNLGHDVVIYWPTKRWLSEYIDDEGNEIEQVE